MAADADIDVTKCKAGYSVYVMPRRNMARNIVETLGNVGVGQEINTARQRRVANEDGQIRWNAGKR